MTYEEFCNIWIPLGESLLGTAAGILGSREDGEDALQDLFIKLWQMRDTLDHIGNPKGYATRVLKNLCIDRIRTRRPGVELLPELEGFECEDAKIENLERIKTVAEAIRRLPSSQREVLELHTMQGLGYDEISQLTGKSQLTLRVLLSRARKTLKQI